MLSKKFSKACSNVCVFTPFEHAGKIIESFLNIHVSETTLMKIVNKAGEKIYQDFNNKEVSKQIKNSSKIIYIQSDGSMVPTIGEEKIEYKENKLGLVFSDRDIKERKRKNGEKEIEIKNKRFVSSLGKGVEEFQNMLFKAAKIKGSEKCQTLIFLTDGAAWLKNIKHKHFKNAIHILDWYHAVEHLWQTANVLFGEENKKKSEEWVNPLKEKLWTGEISTVINYITEMAKKEKNSSKSTSLFNLRTYYVNNQNNMKYNYYRNQGYYIGSGAIESANKYIVSNRLKMSGMRWTIKNANSLIWLRCKYFEEKWDHFWDNVFLPDLYNQAS